MRRGDLIFAAFIIVASLALVYWSWEVNQPMIINETHQQ